MLRISIIIFASFFILDFGYSQNENYKKNEIAINIFTLTKTPETTGNIFKNSVYGEYFSNISYTRFLNNRNAIRVTYYRPFMRNYKTEYNNQLNGQWYKERFYLKTGYEYRIVKSKKIKPYIALDVFYLNSRFDKVTGNLSDIGRIIESSCKKIFGTTFVLGLDYKVNNFINLGIESNIAMDYTKEEKSSFSYCENMYCSNLIYWVYDNYVDYMLSPVLFNIKIKF